MRPNFFIGAEADSFHSFSQENLDTRQTTADLTAQGLEQWGIPCSKSQLEQLMRVRDILLEWNAERMNLTRLVSPEEIAVEHFLDSASLLTVLKIAPGASLLDVGAGAGPDMRRVWFVHGRAEDAKVQREIGSRFDVVTARAVAPLIKLAPWCAAYMKRRSGIFAALKGAAAEEEVRDAQAALAALNLSAQITPVIVPGSDRTHTIVVCRQA